MEATPRILIVDDEPDIRAFLSLTFDRAGYAVTTVGSGRHAIALCSVLDFDIVLSDVMMPEMNGLQLAHWLSAHRPNIPTVLMSGFDAVRERSLPVRRLIAKPFRPKEIVSFVGQVLAAS
jgi:CheY-like chemotaxis protein